MLANYLDTKLKVILGLERVAETEPKSFKGWSQSQHEITVSKLWLLM